MTKMILPRTPELGDDFLGDPSDALKHLFARALQGAIDMEFDQRVGVPHYERGQERQDQRNGSRSRRWDTRLGTVDLEIPRLRQGTYFPSFLERFGRAEQALIALIQEAMISGVSTRRIRKLAQELGIESFSKSRVSELCAALDEEAKAFRERPLTGNYPYLFLDAIFEKVRIDRVVRSQACVIAYGVREDGTRELLGLDVVDTESLESWAMFLRGLRERGLAGVKLVITDAHGGLIKAVESVFVGASWQRCKVHFMRNVLAHAPEACKAKLGAALSGIFTQPDQEAALATFAAVREQFQTSCGKAMGILEDGLSDALSFMAFPREHWSRISSTNPIERINREIRRRTRSIGIFPNVASALRLIGMILLEQTEEWQIGKRYMSEASMTQLAASTADSG
jgi:putative transposase